MPSTPRSVALATRLFRLCLRFYPPAFRKSFGTEMLVAFRESSTRFRLEAGSLGMLAYWWTAFTDLLRTAAAERREARGSQGGYGSRTPLAPRKDRLDMLDDLGHDIRYALRSMLHNRGFTAAALLSLSLGIGANVAIYSLVDAVLLRPLPLRDAHELVAPGTSITTYPAYRDFRDRARSFSGLAAWDTRGRRLVVRAGDQVAVVPGVLVSGNYFSVLGVEPHLGRTIVPADDAEPSEGPVAVIGYNLWRTAFGADPDVLGRRITVNGYPLTIIGVAPHGFRGERLNNVYELWAPLAMHPLLTPGGENDLDDRDAWWIRMMGRLGPGATPESALAELNAIGAELAAEHPATDSEWVFDEMLPAQTIASISRREELTTFMWMLAATVGAALLIACANVSNLLLLRAEQRRGEIGMRRALGATRGRLLRQLLTESLVLALLGGVGGVAVASGALGLLQRFELPGRIDIGALEVGVESSTLLAALTISLATALLFGSLPAMQGARSNRAATGARPGGSWMRGGFAALQVALSLVLLAGGGLFARSLINAVGSDVGFDGEPLLIAEVNMNGQGFGVDRAEAFFDEVTERLEALPGVASVTFANSVPVETRSYFEDVVVEGYEPGADDDRVQSIHLNMVLDDYFETVGIPLLRGRALDTAPGSREVVVNETLAARYWPGEEPLGKRLQLGNVGAFEVVGVMATTTLRRLGEDPIPSIVAPLFFGGDVPSPRMALRMSTESTGGVAPGRMAAAIRTAFAEVSATVPVTGLRTWAEHTGRQTQTQQMGATLLGFFSIVALTLAAIGIYGVMAFGVARRTRELGIRAALGAGRDDLVRLALRGGIATLLVGVAAGLLLALAAGRTIAGLLFGVTPYDPATLAAAVLAITAVGLTAAWLPARRATRIDPSIAFRSEP